MKTTAVLKYFDNYSSKAYEEFISEDINSEINAFYDNKFSKAILGTEKFVENILSQLTNKQKVFCQPDIGRFKKLPSIETIVAIVAEYFSVDTATLKITKRGKLDLPRMLAIFLARQCCHLTYKKISEHFTQLKNDSVEMAIKRFEKRIQEDSLIEKHYINLIRILEDSLLYVST